MPTDIAYMYVYKTRTMNVNPIGLVGCVRQLTRLEATVNREQIIHQLAH